MFNFNDIMFDHAVLNTLNTSFYYCFQVPSEEAAFIAHAAGSRDENQCAMCTHAHLCILPHEHTFTLWHVTRDTLVLMRSSCETSSAITLHFITQIMEFFEGAWSK